jgi:glycerol kinase
MSRPQTPGYVGALDQGTTSTRFIVFDRNGEIIVSSQKEHAQICPRPGWVEHDQANPAADAREPIVEDECIGEGNHP